MRFNGRKIKPVFADWFDDIDNIELVKGLPIRVDNFICESMLLATGPIKLRELSNETILNLYMFAEGVRFLYLHLEELSNRNLLMYMFSSPFLSEAQLLELLHGPLMANNYHDSYLEHLASNELIYE